MATRPALSSVCSSCRRRLLHRQRRLASTDHSSTTTNSSNTTGATSTSSVPKGKGHSFYEKLFPKDAAKDARSSARSMQDVLRPQRPTASSESTVSASSQAQLQSLLESANAEAATRPGAGVPANEPYHLHIQATKRNTHITFTEPSRNPILSYSCGNIGLRKAQRGSFDAAYQLATYTMRKMAMHQWRLGGKRMSMNQMKTLRDIGTKDTGVGIEVVLRGFGPGREAFQKALLGTDGQMIKPLISRVTDATRLKFGGTRSPAVRRLG